MGGGVEVVVTEPLWEGKEGFYCSAERVPVLILCNIMRLNPVGLSLEGAAKGGVLNSYDVPVREHDSLPRVFKGRRGLASERYMAKDQACSSAHCVGSTQSYWICFSLAHICNIYVLIKPALLQEQRGS